jgi:hypothetical protein
MTKGKPRLFKGKTRLAAFFSRLLHFFILVREIFFLGRNFLDSGEKQGGEKNGESNQPVTQARAGHRRNH